MPLARQIEITGVPLQGGAITVREKALLKPGEFSWIQNVKPTRPGFSKRAGQRALHSTADGTNQAMSAYQFLKTRIVENKYFIQMSDGDVLELTNAPPTVTAGAMGSEAYSGNTSPEPASWANLNDILLFSNGVDQHQLYPGATSYVDKFVVYISGGAEEDMAATKGILDEGTDYSLEISDGLTTTVALLNDMKARTAGGAVYICTMVPAKSFTFTVQNTNDNASTMSLYYWKNTSAWAAVSDISDGTDVAGDTLGKSGTVTFTAPSDVQERFLFGRVGYWYLLGFSAALDASVSISKVTYDAPWHSLKAHWDGAPVYAVQVLVEGTSQYDTYAGESVDLDALALGKKIYICSADPIEGIYIDPGDTPNATGTSITTLKYWTGSAWAALTVAADGSTGMSNAGWVLFNRQTAAQPRHMEASKIRAYWYELIFSAEIAADVVVAMYVMPFFEIENYGNVGSASAVWKERALWTFVDRFQEYVYITASDNPYALSSEDSGTIQVGDGRPHKIVAIKNFFNNVLVYQEEKGSAGGCITMLQGYSRPTFGKLVLSTKIGGMSVKAIDVVENVYTATATDEELKTVAFSLSRYGVVACDGVSIGIISDDIQNYFDPSKTECIRAGYENQMWLKHDPVDHVIRIGLVSGASATVPNVFPVYDLITRQWYFDVRAQALSFWENVDSGAAGSTFTQIAGGVADGLLYQVNYGTADVSTAIDTYIRMEFSGRGHYLALLWFMIQCVAKATGNITLTTYQNGIQKDQLTLSMAAEVTNQEIRRHLLSLNVVDQHIALKIQNSSATDTITVMNVGVEMRVWLNR